MAVIGYVTVAEAAEYINTRYASTDELRQAWEAMDEADQAVYLQKSFDAINILPFRGRKYTSGQESAFPRWPSPEIPKAIKYAQIENALTLTDTSAQEDAAFYEKMWQYGVESYRIGNLSESSSNGAWGRSGSSTATRSVASAQALNLLQPYLMGGFSIE